MRFDACDPEVASFDSLVEVRRERGLESEIAAETMVEREKRMTRKNVFHEVLQNVRE